MKLKTLSNRIKPSTNSRVPYVQYASGRSAPSNHHAGGSADKRIQGRALQSRRKKLWTQSPCCAMCGRITEYPSGFELDHIIPLFANGSDDESNQQILCSGDEGCHKIKTKQDEVTYRAYRNY